MSSKAVEQLIQQIELAFADAEYPGDDNLVGKVAHVDTLKLLLAFKEKHRKEIAPEVLFKFRLDLSRFTAAAFCFYLPAYLIVSLRGEDRGEIIDHVVWYLADQQDGEGNTIYEFLPRFEILSSKQRLAVKEFVRYYAETSNPRIFAYKKVVQFWENYSI